MDEVARLKIRDRADIFRLVAQQRGDMRATLIEKDFWVCWTLKRIFTAEPPIATLIFKGGTSLSKVYRAIARFSEDVDLSVDRAALGFGEQNDPALAPSKKKRNERLDELKARCGEWVRNQLRLHLMESFERSLDQPPSEDTWQVEVDPDDVDHQTLLFRYPQETRRGPQTPGEPYVRPTVKLELGARGEQWPVERRSVLPYAAETLPRVFTQPDCPVTVLTAERTFWEKAVALHAWYHLPPEKALPLRSSRHYYDVAQLFQTREGTRAIVDIELLNRVREHKSIFFAAASARYELARPGSLRLVPPPSRRPELERDYRMMQEMFFGAPPSLDQIYSALESIERQVNSPPGSTG